MGRDRHGLKRVFTKTMREPEAPAEEGSGLFARSTPLVTAVSVAGPGHAGGACEDASSCRVVSGRAVVAMADGLGSVPRGGEGAAAAVRAAIDCASSLLESDLLIDSDELVYQMVLAGREILEKKADDPRDLACTIIACVGAQDSLAVGHIGDGAVVAMADEGLVVVSSPGPTEYANEVEHLGQPDWRGALRLAVAAPVHAFAVLTDGLQRAALVRGADGLRAFAPFFLPLFHHVSVAVDAEILTEELSGLLSGERLSAHSEDDKSLALAVLARTDLPRRRP